MNTPTMKEQKRKVAGAFIIIEDEQPYLIIHFEDGDDVAQEISDDDFESWKTEGLEDKTPAPSSDEPEDSDDTNDDIDGLDHPRHGPSDD